MKKYWLMITLALLLCAVVPSAAFASGNDYENSPLPVDYQFEAPALGSVVYTSRGVSLSWNKVWNNIRYAVFRKTNGGDWAGIAATTGLSYRDENVKPGVTYTYTVCCLSTDGKKLLSPYDPQGLTVTIPSDTPVGQLAAPVLLEARNVSGGVQVSWQAVSGVSRYGIFRRTGSGGWAGLAATSATSYTDTTVKPGTTYGYTVCCLSADGNSLLSACDKTGLSVTVPAAEPKTETLPTPVLLEAKSVGGAVQVSWQAVSGASRYGVFRRMGNSGWVGLAVTSATSYTDDSVKPATPYTYTVCCLSADGKSFLSGCDMTGKTVMPDAAPESAPTIVLQPTDTTVRQMTYASFTTRATGSGLACKWELLTKGSHTWYELPNIPRLIEGADSDTLKIAAILGLDGACFRCLVSDGQTPVYTNTVTLHVTP